MKKFKWYKNILYFYINSKIWLLIYFSNLLIYFVILHTLKTIIIQKTGACY